MRTFPNNFPPNGMGIALFMGRKQTLSGGCADEEDLDHRGDGRTGHVHGGLSVVGSHAGHRDVGNRDLGDDRTGHNLVKNHPLADCSAGR